MTTMKAVTTAMMIVLTTDWKKMKQTRHHLMTVETVLRMMTLEMMMTFEVTKPSPFHTQSIKMR